MLHTLHEFRVELPALAENKKSSAPSGPDTTMTDQNAARRFSGMPGTEVPDHGI
jgi:transposase